MLKSGLVVVIGLMAGTASAHSARLLSPQEGGDAPKVFVDSASGSTLLAPSAVSLKSAPASLWLMRGATAGVGIAAVPLSLWLANAFGSLSNNLIASAIPSLLIMGLLAPTITALISWALANTNMPDGQRVGFWLPWLGAVGMNIVLMVAGGFLGLSLGSPLGLMAFSVIDGFAMSFATTGIQQLMGRSANAVTTLETHSPGESTVNVITLSRVSF